MSTYAQQVGAMDTIITMIADDAQHHPTSTGRKHARKLIEHLKAARETIRILDRTHDLAKEAE